MTPLAVIGSSRPRGRGREAGIGVGGVVGHRAAVSSGDGGLGWTRAVSEVAAEVGVSRQSLHAWVAALSRRRDWPVWSDRSQRPRRSAESGRRAELEARVCELRRAHPKWGAQRIVHELMRGPAPRRVAVARDGAPHPRPPRAGDPARAAAQDALGVCALAAAGGDAAVAAGRGRMGRGRHANGRNAPRTEREGRK